MLVPRRASIVRVLLGLAALLALTLPASAAAAGTPIEVEIVNQSGVPDKDVFITPTSPEPEPFDVEGFERKGGKVEPKTLEEIGGRLKVADIASGRIYVAFGNGVNEHTTFGSDSQTRFDWIELTTGGDANLTAVSQFAIGMRLETLNGMGATQETLSEANADTIFNALQQIPGGPQATIRNGSGQIIRVVSPQLAGPGVPGTAEYPQLNGYLASMAGQTVVLHSTFNSGSTHIFSRYTASFGPEGTATLDGVTDPPGQAPEHFVIPAAELLKDIYTGEETPNDIYGVIRHDLYIGFVGGFWGGRYGNDSAAFCTAPNTNSLGLTCPQFNAPSYGDARASLSPYPTCEQYAAVINQLSDSYGNPYSDGFKKTLIPLGESIKTLRLTILPDSGNSGPINPGNPSCGAVSAGPPAPAPKPPAPPATAKVAVHAKLLAHTKLTKGGGVPVAQLNCSAACGKVRAVVRKGKKVVARALVKRAGKKAQIVAEPTKPGRQILRSGSGDLKLRAELWVTPAGSGTQHFNHALLLKR